MAWRMTYIPPLGRQTLLARITCFCCADSQLWDVRRLTGRHNEIWIMKKAAKEADKIAAVRSVLNKELSS